MLRVLIEKELRDLLQSPRFAVTFGVVALLVLLAFWLGGSGYLQARSEYDASVAEVRRQLEGQTDWSGVEPILHRPPSPLDSLVAGIGHDVGRMAEIDPGAPVVVSSSLYGDRPMLALWRFLDLDFIFRVVLSLFAILFAFDAISGEKERGTLRLALSNSIPRDTYILGKMTGAFLGLAVPLLLPILAGCLLLIAMGVPMSGEQWWRLAAIVAAGFLYLASFLGLSLLVSASTRRASSSFLILLVLWIALVLVVPPSAVLAAGRLVEVPSIDDGVAKRSRLATQLFREDRQALEKFLGTQEGELQFEIGGDEDPQKAVARIQARINGFVQERADERKRQLDALDSQVAQERRNRESHRQAVAFGLARLSPAAVFSLAAVDLAGTSLLLPYRFSEQARAYRDVYESFLRQKNGSTGGFRIMVRADVEGAPEPTAIDPSEMPTFHFVRAGLPESGRAAAADLALLVAFTTLFFAGAFVAFLRYDVR